MQLVKKFPGISRNPKVHYRIHKRPPPVSILGLPNPVHVPTSHLLQIHPNIIHPSMPRSPQWSPSLRFPCQDPIHPPPFTHAPHAQPISFFSILSPAQYCTHLPFLSKMYHYHHHHHYKAITTTQTTFNGTQLHDSTANPRYKATLCATPLCRGRR